VRRGGPRTKYDGGGTLTGCPPPQPYAVFSVALRRPAIGARRTSYCKPCLAPVFRCALHQKTVCLSTP